MLLQSSPPARASDAAVYAAVVRSIRLDLHSIPHVRVFVMNRTTVVTAPLIERLSSKTPGDTGELQAFLNIQGHAAHRNMLERSKTAAALRSVSGATVVAKAPKTLRCEGDNWELSRDVVVGFGVPGYSRDGREAVVFATSRECISGGNFLFLLERAGREWQIVQTACLDCWGE